jgi:DNA-binding LacI/PurR family transcriptional regulator
MMTRIIRQHPSIDRPRKGFPLKARSSPTSRDVAARAGVSRSIVSGVLNGTMSTMRVSDETRLRILAAAEELGYTPNPNARALRRQRSNVLGFVPRSNRLNPYDSPVPFLLAMHLPHAGTERGYHFVTANPELPSHDNTEHLIQFLLGRHVGGIVLDSPESADGVVDLVERGVPVVQVIRPRRDVLTPAITIDPTPGTTEAIAHLIESGHRDIAVIGVRSDHPIDRERIDTVRAVLAAAGIPLRDERVILVKAYNIANGRTGAELLTRQATLPTALFVTGDNLAAGVLQHLYLRGIRVPEDLSVISYDDIYASHLAPALTSVNQPLREAADHAVRLLAAAIETPAARGEPEQIVLPTHLVKRGSVRRLEG